MHQTSNEFARIEDFEDQTEVLKATRRYLHAHPELSFEERETAIYVADKLESWGYEVTRNIGGHGVVARLSQGSGGRSIAIRADMDALPITESTDLPYASTISGKMHACGHDGHTAILLGAAEYLARTRHFNGTVNLIFQPAEEAGKDSGAQAMIKDGLFDRFPCDAIFGLHNHPGMPAGTFLTRPGPIMAGSATATIRITGRGGHASRPHLAIDPIVVAANIIMSLQTVVSRSVNPMDPAVVTVGTVHGGTASNVISETAELTASIRSFSHDVGELLEKRVRKIVASIAEAHEAQISIDYEHGYPVVVNSDEETAFATEVLKELVGEENVALCPMIPGSEDFAYYLEHKPGCFLRLGNGENSAMLHNSKYDFNDDSLVPGAAMWARLAERFLSV